MENYNLINQINSIGEYAKQASQSIDNISYMLVHLLSLYAVLLVTSGLLKAVNVQKNGYGLSFSAIFQVAMGAIILMTDLGKFIHPKI
ncbi:hypothetical protein [Gluconobacter cerinus]|uniref:hypothetical protein n=1 Tax=Gluconobacter cerinus TaxID=38307 RepID=UPI001B8CCC9B|nr:hypothetical protein [Gluconobacter cerinus]MBS1038099.1 hypothetical protein [Gluconobacter cerinus]